MTEKEKVEMITLIHMQTGFYLLAIGYLLALFSLIVECIVEFRKAQEQISVLQEKNLASNKKNLASQEQISALKEKNTALKKKNLASQEHISALKEKYLAVKEKLNSLLPNSVDVSSPTEDNWWKWEKITKISIHEKETNASCRHSLKFEHQVFIHKSFRSIFK